MAVLCKFCSAEALDDAIFCEGCGQKLESPAADSVPTVACPNCGTANPPDSAFCEECGSAIPPDAEKGGRKPGFLGLAAKAGAAGVGLGGAGIGLASALGGGGGGAAAAGGTAAASAGAGAGGTGSAGEAISDAMGKMFGHSTGDAGASAGSGAGGTSGTGGSGAGGTPGSGPTGGTSGTPTSGTGGQTIKPDLTHQPSVHGPTGGEGTGGSGASSGGTGTSIGGGASSGGTGSSTGGGVSSGGTGTASAGGGASSGGTATGGTTTTPTSGVTPGGPGGGATGVPWGPPSGGGTTTEPHHHGGTHGRAGAGIGAGAGAGAGGGLGLIGLLGALIKWGLIALITLIGVGVGATLVGGALIFTGNPSPCSDRVITPSTAASQQLKDQWDAFEADAANGKATLALDETGVTSRGVEYIDEKNLPLKDLQVRFCPDGLAEAQATVKGPGVNAHVLMRGTLDLSGSKPRIDVREIKAGNMPSFFGDVDWIIKKVVKKGNADVLDLKPHITNINIKDGSATLTAGP